MEDKFEPMPEDPTEVRFEEYKDCVGDATVMMKKHLLCTLCGSHLQFNHLADVPHGLIQETARCLDCGIRIRQRLHRLQ